MKKYLIALLFIVTANCFAANVRITANRDNQGTIVNYTASTWNGKDLGQVDTKYTIAEAQATFGKLLDGVELGTSASPDRHDLIFDDDGNLVKVVAYVFSVRTYDIVNGKPENEQHTGKYESVQKDSVDLSTEVKDDVVATKEDVETKTGKDIGGGEIKPKGEEPIP